MRKRDLPPQHLKDVQTNFIPAAKKRRLASLFEVIADRITDKISSIRALLTFISNTDSPYLLSELQMFGSLSNLLFAY